MAFLECRTLKDAQDDFPRESPPTPLESRLHRALLKSAFRRVAAPLMCTAMAGHGGIAADATGNAALGNLALACLRARAGEAPVRVLHFGDSHLEALETRQTFKSLLQQRFGDGGAGLGLPWVVRMPGVRAQATPGWKKGPRKPGADTALGLSATYFEAAKPGERATVSAAFNRMRLHALRRPGGGALRIRADGRDLGTLNLEGPMDLTVFERDLGAGSHSLELTSVSNSSGGGTGSGTARILGLALEAPGGAIHSALAFNGAQADWMLALPENLFISAIRAERPDLLVLSFGTNEANGRRFDARAYQQALESLLWRFRKAAPSAAILLAGPPDGRLPQGRAGALNEIIATQKALASRFGGLFVDRRELMGGTGAIASWAASGLAQRDLIHLVPCGYERLARLVLGRLFQQMEQLRASGTLNAPLRRYARAAQTAPGAFAPPAEAPSKPARTSSPSPISLKPTRAVPADDHPLYTFLTEDGRTIITDRPNTLVGERGDWVGRRPR